MTKVQGLFSIVCALGVLACSQPAADKPAPAKAEPGKQEAAPRPEPSTTPATVREDVPLPLPSLLGQSVQVVQSRLGEPPGKGMARTSCVRFVPERVWFRCQYATQRYADPTGTFAGVAVEYEDGVATSLGFEGWKKGAGPVDPAPLLAAIGLELPEPPKVDMPADDVRRWAWFNDRARLKLGGLQYRVEMTVVGDDWARSKISVILNEPLTEAQKAAILPTGKQGAPPAGAGTTGAGGA